jgi:hypothetical protein
MNVEYEKIPSALARVTIYKQGDKIDCGNYSGISLFSITKKILHNTLLARLIPYGAIITGNVSVDLNVTRQVLIVQSNLVHIH